MKYVLKNQLEIHDRRDICECNGSNKTINKRKQGKSLLKKIPGGIRCYKEHGIKYTFKRFLEHLGIPMGIGLEIRDK